MEDSLRAALREAVEKTDFAAEQRIKYVASATHQEIINGALKTPVTGIDPADHVFAYLREMDPPPHGDKAGDYLDLLPDGTLDPHAKAQMDGLKEELAGNPPKVGGKLPKDHIYKYKAQWHGGAQFDEGVLEAFADQVSQDLVKVIDQELEKITAPDALTREKQLQADSAQRLTEFFTGQEEPRRHLAAYLKQGSGKPLALIGPSGSGKSSLMAQAMEEAAGGFSGVIIFRFIGATSASSNPHILLRQICEEIAGAYHTSLPSLLKEGEDDQKLGTYAGLSEIFSRCLALVTENQPLLLFLDALDQLQEGRFDFLPHTLSDHARIVVSALPELEDRLSFAEVHRLPLMPEQDGEELLGKWLAAEARTLTDSQRQEVIGKFCENGLPLYLKLAFEQARMWHSYDVGKVLLADVAGILARYFDLLEKEHTAELVRKVTGYLMCGKYQGLTEAEILDILVFDREYWESFVQGSHDANRAEIKELERLPVVVWSRLFLDLEPYLTERDADGIPIITFYHGKFLEYAGERYLSSSPPLGPRRANGDLEEYSTASPLWQRGVRGDLDLAAKFHATLAGYFETLPLSLDAPEQSPNVSKVVEQPNYRKLSELPYQWSMSKEFAHLADCLNDATFMRESCLTYGPNDLLVFAEEVVNHLNRENDRYKKTAIMREAIKKYQPLLNHEPSCLLQQVILTAAESPLDPAIEAWKEQLKIHAPTPWVFTAIGGPLPPKSPLHRDLGLQEDWVPTLATDSVFQNLYTLNMSGNFRRYNIRTGIMEIDSQAKEKKRVQALTFALFQPHKALLGYTDGRVFEWVDGDKKCVFHPPDPYTVNAIEIIPRMKLILIAPGQHFNRSIGTLFILDSQDYHIISKIELDDRLVVLNEGMDEKRRIINQHGVQVNRMMTSPNSHEIAFAFHHGEVSLFNLDTGIWRRIFFLPEKAVYDLVFDQTGNILFFGGGDENQGFLLAFDLLNWSNCASRVLPAGVTAMTMAGKPKHFIVGDWDGNISFLHPQTLETEQCFSSDVYGCVRCLVSDPAAQFFAASGRSVRIFTLNTSLPPGRLGMADWTWHAVQAHAGLEQGLALAWNMRLGLRAVSLITGEILACNDSINNARCATQAPIAIASSLQAVYTISLPGLKILDSLEIGVHGVVHGIALNSKGTRGACLVTKGGKTYLCDLNINPSSKTITIADRITLDSYPGPNIPTAISEDGSFIVAIASQSHKLKQKTEGSLANEIEIQPVKLIIWNVRTRQTKTIVIKTLVGALALSSDSSMMCLAPGPQFEFVGGIEDFNINRFEARNHPLDEKATISTPSISLWDLRKGAKLADFGHVDDIISLDITRDGRHIASLSDDGTLRIWDVASGKNLAMIGFEGRPLWCGFSDSKREILALFRGWRADLRVIPRRLLIEE